MDGPKEPLRIKTAFVTGAVDEFPHSADRQRMKGIHETIEEVCRRNRVDAFVPFLTGASYGVEAFARDLIIIEATFLPPIVIADLRRVIASGKPVLLCHERSAVAVQLYAATLPVWRAPYDKYSDLSWFLKDWFMLNVRVD